jgi:hypothetical protein
MDCLKSFTFILENSTNFTTPDVNVWGTAPQNYWNVRVAGSSTFTIEGFKNINIHKIEIVGNINSRSTGNNTIVQDWELLFRINGNQIGIGNTINATNNFGLLTQLNGPYWSVSKFNPFINLETPITSVQSIQVIRINANGIGVENIITPSINLNYFLTFVCYYSFEGEELLF